MREMISLAGLCAMSNSILVVLILSCDQTLVICILDDLEIRMHFKEAVTDGWWSFLRLLLVV